MFFLLDNHIFVVYKHLRNMLTSKMQGHFQNKIYFNGFLYNCDLRKEKVYPF